MASKQKKSKEKEVEEINESRISEVSVNRIVSDLNERVAKKNIK